MLAPPLLSKDIFSYLEYARLGVVHHVNPYGHVVKAFRGDDVYRFLGWRSVPSAYGPLFTVATYPLANLSAGVGLWTIKLVTAGASLGCVALVGRQRGDSVAPRLPRQPFLGLQPGADHLRRGRRPQRRPHAALRARRRRSCCAPRGPWHGRRHRRRRDQGVGRRDDPVHAAGGARPRASRRRDRRRRSGDAGDRGRRLPERGAGRLPRAQAAAAAHVRRRDPEPARAPPWACPA